MKYNKIHTLIFILIGGVLNSSLVALNNNDTINWNTISFITQKNTFINSENASNLHTFNDNNLTNASLYFIKDNGNFKNYSESNNSLNTGINIESYYRFNKRIVFYGNIGYEYFFGKNMSGSYFINPYNTPFDIVEWTEDNRGTKQAENYYIIGSLSGDLLKNLHIGGTFNYCGSNYTKQKDLRHTNKLMDMKITIGLSYRPIKWIEIGANYYYKRRIEELSFSSYGTTDKVFKSLINYGGFFGKVETFGENGYTNKSEAKPICDNYHGIGVQLNIYACDKLKIFNEFAYRNRKGYYGNKSPYRIVYSEHHSIIYQDKLRFNINTGRNIHNIAFEFYKENLINNENIYRRNSEESGKNYIEYLGQIETSQKGNWNVKGEYSGDFSIKNNCPTWGINIGAYYSNNNTKASVYPNYRKQIINIYQLKIDAKYNIIHKRNIFGIKLSELYRIGNGTENLDKSYIEGSNLNKIYSMDSFMHQEYEWMTASQLHSNITFRYTRGFTKPKMKIYAQADYNITTAFNTKYIKDGLHHHWGISVGCIF